MRTYFNTINKIFCVANCIVDVWENSEKILKWDSTPEEIENYKNGRRVWKIENLQQLF